MTAERTLPDSMAPDPADPCPDGSTRVVPRRSVARVVRDAAASFIANDCTSMAAAISYYTVFALPAMFVLFVVILGTLFEPEDVHGRLEAQVRIAMGAAGADQLRAMLTRAKAPTGEGLVATLIGTIVLMVAATGAFIQLQDALNKTWGVGPDPRRSAWRVLLLKRLLGLGMVLVLAAFLLASLALSAVLSAFGDSLVYYLPEGMSALAVETTNFIASFAVTTALFAAMFRILPDARIGWRDVWVGAVVTALLFAAGKLAFGLYLGRVRPGEAFGAAGALAVMFLWIYYSAIILLFGSELTQEWAESRGCGIVPESGAIRLVRETRPMSPAELEAEKQEPEQCAGAAEAASSRA